MIIKIIKNSKKYGPYTLIIDAESFSDYQKGSWTYSKHGNRFSCAHRNNKVNHVEGYRLFHRLVLKAKKGQIVDHINGNALDNRKSNLRITNASGNARNRKVSIINKSNYKGVHLHKNGYWIAQIVVDGAKIYLGKHSTPEMAAAAYDEGALFFHSEFAKGNSI